MSRWLVLMALLSDALPLIGGDVGQFGFVAGTLPKVHNSIIDGFDDRQDSCRSNWLVWGDVSTSASLHGSMNGLSCLSLTRKSDKHGFVFDSPRKCISSIRNDPISMTSWSISDVMPDWQHQRITNTLLDNGAIFSHVLSNCRAWSKGRQRRHNTLGCSRLRGGGEEGDGPEEPDMDMTMSAVTREERSRPGDGQDGTYDANVSAEAAQESNGRSELAGTTDINTSTEAAAGIDQLRLDTTPEIKSTNGGKADYSEASARIHKGGADVSAMDTESDRIRSKESERVFRDARSDVSTSHTEDMTGMDGDTGRKTDKPKKYRHPTGNPKRDMIRDKFATALQKYEMPGDKYSALTAAIAIEHSMYRFYGKDETSNKYNAKCRAILFNLRDANNPDFRRRVLSGVVQPERVTMMDSVEMASDLLKKQRSIYSSIALQSVMLGSAEDQYAVTDMFFCRKCQQRKCTYYQMQTRSADEPMTTFVTCLHCGNRWKA